MTERDQSLARWQVTEYLGLDWPEEVVHADLTLPGQFPDGPLSVVDETGRAVPAQLIRQGQQVQVWYPARLHPYEAKTYHLVVGQPSQDSPLQFRLCGSLAEVTGQHFAVRLAWTAAEGGVETYADPQPLADLPGPIQRLRGPDGVWFGGGRWRGEMAVHAWRCEIIEQGPVIVILRQTYTLADEAEISLEYRLDAAAPAVQVTTRCRGLPAQAALEVELYQPGTFEPTHVFWRPHSPSAWHGPSDAHDFSRQIYILRWPASPDRVRVYPFHAWVLDATVLWACWEQHAERNDMLVAAAIRPSRTYIQGAGQQVWTGASVYDPLELVACEVDGRKQLTLTFPLQNGQKLFFLGMLDRQGALPTYGAPHSRVECLHRQMQCLSLDEYQQMCLDWPGMDQIPFPHLMLPAKEVPQVRQRFREWPWLRERFEAHVEDRFFDAHDQPDMRIRALPSGDNQPPLGSDWGGAYLLTGDVTYAQRARQQIESRIDRWVQELAGIGPTADALIGISIARPWRAVSITFDFIAASDAFSKEERLHLLRKLAFIYEACSTADAWPPPESGIGRGNPNFHSDVVSAKGIAAALLNGHPRQREGMDAAVREMAEYMRNYHFPSGCSREAATYQLAGLNHVLLLAVAVRNAGGRDLFADEPAILRSFDYLAQTQTPPDPRSGFCMLPTLGHVTVYPWCQTLQVYFAWAARFTAQTNPAFSRRMMAAWKRAGGMAFSWHDWREGAIWWPAVCLLDVDLPADNCNAPLASRLYKGLGAILRASHADGTQGYLLVKMGASRGHYDPDEGSLIWYAYGQPLLADFGCQYNPNIECAWLHNRISVNHENEIGTHFRVLTSVLQPGMDYLCGEMPIAVTQAWPEWPVRETEFNARLLPGPHPIPPVIWRRHVLYLHACEAIVLLDELTGDQPTDWNLQVLADEARVTERSAHFRGQQGVDLDVYLAQPPVPDIALSAFQHLGADEPRLPLYWWKGLRWTAPEGTTFSRMDERALTLRAHARPGEDYLALLLARPANQPAARVTVLPDGAGWLWRTVAGEWQVRVGRGSAPWQVSQKTDSSSWHTTIGGEQRSS